MFGGVVTGTDGPAPRVAAMTTKAKVFTVTFPFREPTARFVYPKVRGDSIPTILPSFTRPVKRVQSGLTIGGSHHARQAQNLFAPGHRRPAG